MKLSEMRFNVILSRQDVKNRLHIDPKQFDDNFNELERNHGDELVDLGRRYIENHKKYGVVISDLGLEFSECDNMLVNGEWGIFLGLYYNVP